MPADAEAERIEGVVYIAAAAASAGFHGEPHLQMATWLGVYTSMTPGVMAADNATTQLDPDNDPQPDLCLCVHPKHGGRVKLDENGYITGAPELIVEIAATSMSYELSIKQNAYRRNGVKEYVVYRTYEGEIDWFVLRDDQFQRPALDNQGVYRSEAFPGLWLAEQAMLKGKLADVLTTLQQGLATEAHATFVSSLVI